MEKFVSITPNDKLVSRIRRARELIEAGWIQGFYAADANGRQVSVKSKDACKFCLEGALIKADMDYGNCEIDGIYLGDMINLFAYVMGDRRLIMWNDADCRTAADVIGALNKMEAAVD